MRTFLVLLILFAGPEVPSSAREPPAETAERAARSRKEWFRVSGIYPHLAFFNDENECGTGAVVPWADRLWVVTYAPHAPQGSSDKLYEIDTALNPTIRPESVGGTPANRMIHRESDQLFIGPYAIDARRNVRTIPYARMFGRPTGNARHLTDPANKIYCASMEEALYEIDVRTLDVRTLYHDEARTGREPKAALPGYHGKGLYSGQGRLIYANNGEHGREAQRNPFVPSGVLAEWDGKDWRTVLRAQFTEVTGPGGIHGNTSPETDPVWSVGWDARSLILMLLDDGRWSRFRLPKASHSYDGAHGWNTEWPRIRDIGEDDLLMTMHGMFWRFPRGFSAGETAGIVPRSTYLKVVGDFCRWQDEIVLGCDDTAKNEFLNKRRAKGSIAAPQSQSNLWFLRPYQLDRLGPVIGRGAVWLRDDVPAGTPSDPFLFQGFPVRGVHVAHEGEMPATLEIEVDRRGTGHWTHLTDVRLGPRDYRWLAFDEDEDGVWVRLRSDTPLAKATAWFSYRGRRRGRGVGSASFAGLARIGDRKVTGGVVRARGRNKRTLHFASVAPTANGGVHDVGLYELDGAMKLRRVDDGAQLAWLKKNAAIPSRDGIIEIDAASVVFIDDSGRRFRLPKGNARYDAPGPLGWGRLDREVATERDLFHCHGTFFELPAENAGGFARIRPVSTHDLRITDYCSYRGLFVISGVNLAAAGENRHIVRSDDGRTALWVGAVDDIWEVGKPVGTGGPWKNTRVEAGRPSDPYLMTGYDRKTLVLSQTSPQAVKVMVEVDITGTGQWQRYRVFSVPSGKPLRHEFPEGFEAYWVRLISTRDAVVTGTFLYE